MAKKQMNPTVDLGQMQAQVIEATRALKTAQSFKLRADQAYEDALARHEQVKVSLNAAVAAVKSAAAVANLYAN